MHFGVLTGYFSAFVAKTGSNTVLLHIVGALFVLHLLTFIGTAPSPLLPSPNCILLTISAFTVNGIREMKKKNEAAPPPPLAIEIVNNERLTPVALLQRVSEELAKLN